MPSNINKQIIAAVMAGFLIKKRVISTIIDRA
jgi:hypothetical protein